MFKNNTIVKGYTITLCFFFGLFPKIGWSQNISAYLSFTLKSGDKIALDANNCAKALPTAYFIAIEAKNSGSSEVNVGQITLDSTPANWQILGPVGGVNSIGKLQQNQTKTVYFYVRPTCATKGTTIKLPFKANNGTS